MHFISRIRIGFLKCFPSLSLPVAPLRLSGVVASLGVNSLKQVLILKDLASVEMPLDQLN